MSYTAPDPRFNKQPWELPPVAADGPASGATVTPALHRLLTEPDAPVRDELVAVVAELLRSTKPVFTPDPDLLALLDLPDVQEVRTDPQPLLAALDIAPITHVAGLALAATLPAAAAAVRWPDDIRPSVAGLITVALTTTPQPSRDVQAARDTLAEALTTFRTAVFDAQSANDSALPALAFPMLVRLAVLRRRLLDSTWRHREECWETLDRIVDATYWPPDAVTLTRMDKRLRAYRFSRWRR
jgi:hypothetical protein